MAKRKANKIVETLIHEEATRKTIPTAEYRSVVDENVKTPIQAAYERRNRDLGPQPAWRGKDAQEEAFFVRHAYFLGANDPYKSLRNTLKAKINEEAWQTLHIETSRPFEKPETGRIA